MTRFLLAALDHHTVGHATANFEFTVNESQLVKHKEYQNVTSHLLSRPSDRMQEKKEKLYAIFSANCAAKKRAIIQEIV